MEGHFDSVREELFEKQDAKFQKFTASLLPGVENIIGVRLPEVRKTAKEQLKGDWRDYLQEGGETYFEERMAKAYIIGLAKMDIKERLSYTEWFVPKIDNWSICDSFCSVLKAAKEYPDLVWQFLLPYQKSKREYFARFALVMDLNYYIQEAYLAELFSIFDTVQAEGYYAQMAVSWAISMCFVQFPEETLSYLEGDNHLSVFTYQKALAKIVESKQVGQEAKKVIHCLKDKKPIS